LQGCTVKGNAAFFIAMAVFSGSFIINVNSGSTLVVSTSCTCMMGHFGLTALWTGGQTRRFCFLMGSSLVSF
jgi:hypothetical protein